MRWESHWIGWADQVRMHKMQWVYLEMKPGYQETTLLPAHFFLLALALQLQKHTHHVHPLLLLAVSCLASVAPNKISLTQEKKKKQLDTKWKRTFFSFKISKSEWLKNLIKHTVNKYKSAIISTVRRVFFFLWNFTPASLRHILVIISSSLSLYLTFWMLWFVFLLFMNIKIRTFAKLLFIFVPVKVTF